MTPLNPVSASSSNVNPFGGLNEDLYESCSDFLSYTDARVFARTCWRYYEYAEVKIANEESLELVGPEITNQELALALNRRLKINRLRLINPQLTEEGIDYLGNFLGAKEMRSMVLINCGCLLDYPKAVRRLIEKINFRALEHFAIATSKHFNGNKFPSDRADMDSAVMRECTLPLIAKLQSSRSLTKLDLSLLKPTEEEATALLHSFPATLIHFGPLPGRFTYFPTNFTVNTDEQMAIAIKKVKSETIDICELANTEISAEAILELLDHLPFPAITQITLRRGKDARLTDQVFDKLLLKLKTCERLIALRVPLLPEQLHRLIPALPPTLAEISEWSVTSDAIAERLIAKKFQHLISCKLSFSNISTAKMRSLLESLPLASLQEITFIGLMNCADSNTLEYFFQQLSLNKELRSLHLWGFELGIENQSLPSLLNAIVSSKFESLFISGVTSDKKDRYEKRKRTIHLLKEMLANWPAIKQLEIEDDRAHHWNPINLDSLKEGKLNQIKDTCIIT